MLADRSVVEFRGPRGATLQTDEPLIKLALQRLGDRWPQCVAFAELLAHARGGAAGAGAEPRPRDADAAMLGETLLKAYAANLVALHIHGPQLAIVPGERPRASALVRLQAGAGDAVTNLRHATVRIDDAAGRHLLTLLDGTRDRAALARDIAPHVQARDDVPARLDAKLHDLARLALLEA